CDARQESQEGQLLQALARRAADERAALIVGVRRRNILWDDHVVADADNAKAQILALSRQRCHALRRGHRAPCRHTKAKLHGWSSVRRVEPAPSSSPTSAASPPAARGSSDRV